MNGNDDCRTYVEHLRIEHSHIDHSLEVLQHLLGAAASGKSPNLPGELLARFARLQEQLRHHFREEEEGGCLEEARSLSPCLSENVRELQSQHGGFLRELDALVKRAQLFEKQPAELTCLRVEFGSFLQRLHAHEAEENGIVLRGFGSPAMESLS